MLELTTANVVDYLRASGWLGAAPARADALSGGVSNAVLRIESEGRRFVLKQSRPQLRTHDSWFSDIDRVHRELEVMQALHPLLPPLTVPEVLFVDRPNYVFVMSHSPPEARGWKDALLMGEHDLALAERVGAVLGLMHERTAADPRIVEPFRDHTVYVQLRVEPFYRRVQERRPEVAAAVEPIVARTLSVKEALCHGDYTPKNILIHHQGFMLVDYETAHYGDPSMDLGLCLCHLLLKAVRWPAARTQYFELTRAFWHGYRGTLEYLPTGQFEERGIEHFAVCALARIDGTSPVDYLPEEPKREAVRRLSRRVLWEGPRLWEEVLDMADSELRVLG
jgi:5-methylthioribose kinase